MGSGWLGHQGVCQSVPYSVRGFLFPLMNSLTKLSAEGASSWERFFKGTNSCQPDWGMCPAVRMPTAAEVDFSRESICLVAA